MPLDSINTVQSINFLPPISKSGRLILQIFIFIARRACSCFRKPYRTPDISLILVLRNTNPFIQYFKILQCHIFRIHRESRLSVIPGTRISQLCRITVACQRPEEITFSLTKLIHQIKHIPHFIPATAGGNIPPMRERNEHF